MAMMVPRAKLIKGDPCASSRAIGELEPVTEDAVSIQTIVETRRASSGAMGASLDGWAGRSRQGFPVGINRPFGQVTFRATERVGWTGGISC